MSSASYTRITHTVIQSVTLQRVRNCPFIIITIVKKRWCGGATGRALDLAINRSWVQILLGAKDALQPWASCSHLCASVTKQYNVVLAKPWWCCAAGKVTAGLVESNGSLPPGGWLIVTCRLTACTPGSAAGRTLGNEYGRLLPFLSRKGNMLNVATDGELAHRLVEAAEVAVVLGCLNVVLTKRPHRKHQWRQMKLLCLVQQPSLGVCLMTVNRYLLQYQSYTRTTTQQTNELVMFRSVQATLML